VSQLQNDDGFTMKENRGGKGKDRVRLARIGKGASHHSLTGTITGIIIRRTIVHTVIAITH